jgi:2-alkyl-3-oxoalkanoate reductase
MRILVTGGTGFLGRAVLERLRASGDEVRVLVRPARREAVGRDLDVEVTLGDLRDPPSLAEAVQGVDAVCHCAARVKTKGSWSDFYEDTVRGTERLLEAASRENVRRFLHVSSLGILRVNGDETVTEASPFDDAYEYRGAYARAKFQSEDLVWKYHRERGLPVTVVRPGPLYGPGRPPIIARVRMPCGPFFDLAIVRHRQLFPLAHVENVAEAIHLALRCDGVIGRAYHVVDEEIPHRDYLMLLRRAGLAPSRAIFVPPALLYPAVVLVETFCRALGKVPPFSRHRLKRALASAHYDTSRARTELGWSPRLTMVEALARMRAAGVAGGR